MTGSDPFLDPTPQRLDVYLSRRTILDGLKAQLTSFHGIFLDIGCGRMPYRSLLLSPPSRVEKYIGLDLAGGAYEQFGPFDLEWDGRTMPLADNSIDCAMATEVLEQCPDPELVLEEAARVLKPGGLLFVTVPYLWPVHDPPNDQHRLTPFALERLLRLSGFTDVKLEIGGGWDASLAQMLALWVRRRPMHPRLRRVLTAIFRPFVMFLIQKDRPPRYPQDFESTVMITAVIGTARKAAQT